MPVDLKLAAADMGTAIAAIEANVAKARKAFERTWLAGENAVNGTDVPYDSHEGEMREAAALFFAAASAMESDLAFLRREAADLHRDAGEEKGDGHA